MLQAHFVEQRACRGVSLKAGRRVPHHVAYMTIEDRNQLCTVRLPFAMWLIYLRKTRLAQVYLRSLEQTVQQ